MAGLVTPWPTERWPVEIAGQVRAAQSATWTVAVLSEDPAALELEAFERVDAGPRTVLLRFSARVGTGGCPAGAPTLVIDDGSRLHRLSPLPAPPDPDQLLRAAYSAPQTLLDRDANAFSLELADGTNVDLPTPTTRRPSYGSQPDYAVLEAERNRLRARARELAAELESRIALAAELEHVRQERDRELREATGAPCPDMRRAAEEAAREVGEAIAHARATASRERATSNRAETADAALEALRLAVEEQARAEAQAQAAARAADRERVIPGAESTQPALLTQARSVVRRIPSESTLGIGLVVFGIAVAVLILTGALKVGA